MVGRQVVAILLLAALLMPSQGGLAGGRSRVSMAELAADASRRLALVSGPPQVRPSSIISVGSNLADVAVDRSRPRAYVVDSQNNRVLVIATDTETLLSGIAVGDGPIGVAINPSDTELFVANAANRTISVVDLATLATSRTLSLSFFPCHIVAPSDDQLLVTNRGPGYSDPYPYVLSALDGSVLQRLNPGEAVYQDALIALNFGGRTAYVANTIAPFLFYVFTESGGRWTFQRKGPDFGSGSPSPSDIAVSPDTRMLYFSKWGGAPSRIQSDFGFSGPVGSYVASWSIAVSPSNQFVALSAGDAAVRIVDVSDEYTANEVQSFAVPNPVERLRITPDGTKVLATEGFTTDSWQDVAVIDVGDLTFVRPSRPLGVQSFSPPVLEAKVRYFQAPGNLTADMELDAAPIPSTFDASNGTVQATPGALADGNHTVLVHMLRSGLEVARTNWTFSVVTTQTWYTHPEGYYRLRVPAEWSPTVGGQAPEVTDVYIPSPQANLAVMITGTYLEGSESAPTILERELADRDSYPGFTLLEPITQGVVDGHPAAFAFFRHVLIPDEAFQQLIVVPDYDWGMYWVLIGAMNTRDALRYRSFINETLESFQILGPPPAEVPFPHPATHFSIREPRFWTGQADTIVGGQAVDVLLQSTGNTTILIGSEARRTSGTSSAVRSILQDAIDNIMAQAGGHVLEPPTDWTVDGRAGARATIATEPQPYQTVYQVLAVVVGPEWGLIWEMVATMPEWDWSPFRGLVNRTLASLDIEDAPAPPMQSPLLAAFIGASGAVAAAAVVVVLARRRFRRPPPPLAPQGMPPTQQSPAETGDPRRPENS